MADMVAAMGDAEFAAWLRLLETPGLGRGAARKLLNALGSPEAVLGASPETWARVAGAKVALALREPPHRFAERCAAAQAWRHTSSQHHVLVLGDSAFPASLLQTADPPLLLYVNGDPTYLSNASIAIVAAGKPRRRVAKTPALLPRRWVTAAIASFRGWLKASTPRHTKVAWPRRPARWPWWARDWIRSTRPATANWPHASQRTVPWSASTHPARQRCPNTFPSATASSQACRWARWWWKLRYGRAR